MPSQQNIHVKEGIRMQKNNSTVLIAKSLDDVFYHINTVNNLQILGGCTRVSSINEISLTVCPIPELATIDRKERHIDFGPAVTLAQMLTIGRNKMPSVLYDAISTIGTPAVRNLATLGGNICAEGQKLTLYAPLLALDARLEFRNQTEFFYTPFSKFTTIPHGFVLTKIRVPIGDWEVAIYRRVGPSNYITPQSAGFVFLADMQKDILANIRIAFAGNIIFRSFELENRVIGTRLPLSRKTIDSLVSEAETQYTATVKDQDTFPILKAQFLNLLRYSLEQLT